MTCSFTDFNFIGCATDVNCIYITHRELLAYVTKGDLVVENLIFARGSFFVLFYTTH